MARAGEPSRETNQDGERVDGRSVHAAAKADEQGGGEDAVAEQQAGGLGADPSLQRKHARTDEKEQQRGNGAKRCSRGKPRQGGEVSQAASGDDHAGQANEASPARFALRFCPGGNAADAHAARPNVKRSVVPAPTADSAHTRPP